jgi:mutator protein MutT
VEIGTNILFIRHGDRVLLAMKKRGFGAGKWNGPGGKLNPGETPLQAMIRETQEEVGITPLDPQLVGRLRFAIIGQTPITHDCHIFTCDSWEGDPVETEEMRPQWFHIGAIPYDQMWVDDILWLPLLLEGKSFAGSATLDGDRVVEHDIRIVTSL